MWQLAKRVLPNTALERILFPSKEELLEFFDEDHLLLGASCISASRNGRLTRVCGRTRR
jgi:hypothetical protein